MAAAPLFAIVAGVGPGTGRSVAIKFAQHYPVVLLARKPESLNPIVDEIKKSGGTAIGIPADIKDAASLENVLETIKKELPGSKLAAAVYNVSAGFRPKPFLELDKDEFRATIDTEASGFFNFGQKLIPLLLDAVPDSKHPPSLILTGATASLRGSAKLASFAAGKFTLRALGQSLAREFGPQGVHVAHAVIDGVIEGPRTRDWPVNGGVEGGKLDPDAIADAYWFLHTQPRSAFTQELDLRPFVEKF